MRLLGQMSEEERLEFEQETGIRTAGAIRIVEEARATAEQMIQTAIREVQEVIGPHGSVTRVQAGGVRVTRSGIGVFEDGILKTVMESDGDFHVGSDTGLPATTTFSVFVNDQTYNNEEMGAGDLLIGDNTEDTPNVKYSAADGQLQFRSGTTVKAYMDTDGSLRAGEGNVIITSDGIVIQNLTDSGDPFLLFLNSAGATLGQIFTNSSGNLELDAFGTGVERKLVLRSQVSGSIATIEIVANASGGGSDTVSISADTIFLTAATTVNALGQDFDFIVEGDTDPDLLHTDASTDRVGIGTATPTAKLNVEGSVIINDLGAAVNTRIEGDTDPALFVVEASTDRVGIGTGSPSAKLEVVGNVVITGTVVANNFISGTYAPTCTAVANIDSTSAVVNFAYMRLGSVVIVSGNLNSDATTAGVMTRIRISLPIASNFASTGELTGTGGIQGSDDVVIAQADTTNDAAELQYTPASAAASVIRIMFMYQVI